METTYIYTLTDPRTNEIRYVGKANNTAERYRAHLNRARKHQIHKKNWIELLKREGLKPIIEIIDIVPINEWIFWETYWISQIKTWGFNLINYTNGGDGCTFGNKTSFKKGQGGKKVIGYNASFEKLYEFDSIGIAESILKITGIWHICVGKRKTTKNITWFYFDEIKNLSKIELNEKISKRFIKIRNIKSNVFKKGHKSVRSKKVLVYDLEWNLIKEFESAKLAGEFIGVTGGAVQYASLHSKKNKCKKYKVKYK